MCMWHLQQRSVTCSHSVSPVFVLAPCWQASVVLAQRFRNNTCLGSKVALIPAAAPSLQRFHFTVAQSSCFHAKGDPLHMMHWSWLPPASLVICPPLRTRRCFRRPCKCCRTARPKLTSFACRSAKLCRPRSTTTTHRVSVTQWRNAKQAHCNVILVACAQDLCPRCLTEAVFGCSSSFWIDCSKCCAAPEQWCYRAVGFHAGASWRV